MSDAIFPGAEGGGDAGAIDPSLWLADLSPEKQEQFLLQDVLCILMGGPGLLITEQLATPFGITFSVRQK